MKSISASQVLAGTWAVLKRFYTWVPPRRAAPVARRLKFICMLLAVGLFIYLFGAWILNLLVAAIIVVGGLVLVVVGFLNQSEKSDILFGGDELDKQYEPTNCPHGHDAYGNRLGCGQSSKKSYF